ncbi:hypothetical protein F5887DRAFT_16376 [Amanita rubescens]|nr:hypothetical protein F5887DRAFT_16376 [Amanita rubescens]
MHLYLTNRSHLNCSYINDHGQLLYKVETPFKLSGLVSTITSASAGRLAHLAEIKFNTISSSVMSYDGKVYETSQFFSKKGWVWHRTFTGPDGLEYQWILGYGPELLRRDAARTPVARFHLGCVCRGRPPSLEIFPEGMHMVDLILVTFVYIQKIRNDAKRNGL